MTREAVLELPEDAASEHSHRDCSPSPSVAGRLFGAPRRIGRAEARCHLVGPLWLTSLRKPAVFEVVPIENVSKFGIRMVTQQFWEPAEEVLVSSPPGFWVQGSVVYCKKLPSDDYIAGVRLDAPVEQWMDGLGFRGPYVLYSSFATAVFLVCTFGCS